MTPDFEDKELYIHLRVEMKACKKHIITAGYLHPKITPRRGLIKC